MQKKNIHFLTQAAMIAALYVCAYLYTNAFGLANYAVQVRFSEALTILPIFTTAVFPAYLLAVLSAMCSQAAPAGYHFRFHCHTHRRVWHL